MKIFFIIVCVIILGIFILQYVRQLGQELAEGMLDAFEHRINILIQKGEREHGEKNTQRIEDGQGDKEVQKGP